MKNLKELLNLKNGIQYHRWPILGHEIPVVTISGNSDGPTIMLSGLLHQDELIGPAVFDRLLNDELNLSGLKGNIIILPIVSVYQVGLWRGIDYFRESTSEKVNAELKGGKQSVNANRFFPGKPNGDWMEKFSYEITETFIKKIDVLLDFHCCRMIDGSFAACLDTHAPSIKLASALNLDFVDLQSESSQYSQTMYLQSSILKKTALLLEFPGYSEMSYQWATDKAFNTLKNALIYLQMIHGELPSYSATFFKRADKTDSLLAEMEGYFSGRVTNGQLCKKGDILGVIRKLNDFTIVKKISAPYDGACTSIGPSKGFSIVKPGEEVITFKKAYSLEQVLPN